MTRRHPLLDPQTVFAALTTLAEERLKKRNRPKRSKSERRGPEPNRKRAATLEARRQARIAAMLAARPKRSRMRPWGDRIRDRIAAAMQPGEWYSRGDAAALAGYGRDERFQVGRQMVREGWVQRRANPEWRPVKGINIEPRWLYSLTEKGEAHAAAVRLLW